MRRSVLLLLLLPVLSVAQPLEKSIRERFEAEGAANLERAHLILLVHDYKKDLDTEIIRNMDDKMHVAQLENAAQNLANELMALYAKRDKLQALVQAAQRSEAELLKLRAESNELQRRIEDQKRILGRP